MSICIFQIKFIYSNAYLGLHNCAGKCKKTVTKGIGKKKWKTKLK